MQSRVAGDAAASISQRIQLVITILTTLFTASVGMGAQSALATPAAQVTTDNCHETVLFVPVPYEGVRERVPPGYSLVLTEEDQAQLFIRMARCDVVGVNGATRASIISQVAAVIHSPDGRGCASGTFQDGPLGGLVAGDAIPACNWFVLSWASDHPELVSWLRAWGAAPVAYAKGFSYTYDAGKVLDQRFVAETPSGVPIPFTMVGVVGQPVPPRFDLTIGYWFETPGGRLRVEGDTPEGIFTGFGRLTVCAPAGSPLAGMFVQDDTPLCEDAGDAFTSNGWEKGWYEAEHHDPPLAEQGCGEKCLHELAVARDWTTRYLDASRAMADGYVPVSPCEQDDDGKTMGMHFARMGDDNNVLDPNPGLSVKHPEILLYVPSEAGLRLVAIEYSQAIIVNGEEWREDRPPPAGGAPVLFGRPFDGPMKGHLGVGVVMIQPWHYDLHVWAWAHNPDGLFAQHNPSVKCAPSATEAG
ncbi:MAG TPA: hypothetical protein VM142_12790 [Acidimicrobiales bacterium]|nr:hypothetical protein [Acidimicrobiales bacterium]